MTKSVAYGLVKGLKKGLYCNYIQRYFVYYTALQKKWSFPLRISSVNVTLLKKSLIWKTSFFVQCCITRTWKLSYVQRSTYLTTLSFHFLMITLKHVFKTESTLEKTYFEEWSCLNYWYWNLDIWIRKPVLLSFW